MKKIKLFVIVVSILSLNGCAIKEEIALSHYGTQAFVNSKSFLNDRKNVDFPTLSYEEFYSLCSAAKQHMDIDYFFKCSKAYLERFKDNKSSLRIITSIASHYLQKADMHLALHEYNKAIHAAKMSLEHLKLLDVPYLEKEYIIGVVLTSDSMLPGYAPESYRIQAISYARMGQKLKALNILKELSEFKAPFGQQGSLSNTVADVKFKVYFELKEYQLALEQEIGKESSFIDIISKINKFNPAMFLFGLTPDMMKKKDQIRTISGLYMIARAYMGVGNFKEAKKKYDALLKINKEIIPSEFYWLLQYDLSKIYLYTSNPDQAIASLLLAIKNIEDQRASISTDSRKIGFVGDKQAIYSLLIRTLMNQNRFDEAFAYAERGKARALVDILASKKQFNGGDSTNIAEQHQLIAQLDTAEANTRVMSDPKTHSNTRSVAVKARAAIVLQAPELSSLITVEAPDVKEIQSLLPRGETLLEYYGSKDDLFAFVVTADGIRGVKLNGKGLNADISAFRESILNVKSPAYQQSGNRLYQRLIAPLASGIHTKNLTIVPHGALHYLPFSALTTDHGFMLDRYHIRILPSASVMKFLKSHKNKAGSLLALGNPDLGDAKYDLPFAQKEAIKVSSEVPGAKLLLRSAATETAIKEYGKGFRYLHFASHGTFNAEKPLQSGLLLAKDDKNDGMLTVGELYDLNLNADLVTLSACETALGKVANGDDVVGFTRGFLYAGASTIVSSLWQVDDAATSDLMTSFYTNLGKEDKRSALRDAQLATKKKYHHPYYWAAFQMTGAVQ